MNKFPIKSIACLLAIIALLNSARAEAQAIYPLSTSQQQQQFTELTQQLRCLVCQNESLADSNAPLAQDLRGEIYQQVQAGKSNADIKAYLLARYGQFILFKPAFNQLTYVLWIGPFVLLGIGIVILLALVFRRKRLGPLVLSAEEQQRLDALVK